MYWPTDYHRQAMCCSITRSVASNAHCFLRRVRSRAFNDQKAVTVGLLDLPNELLLSIAQYLEYHWMQLDMGSCLLLNA